MLQNKATKALDFYENKLTYVSFFFFLTALSLMLQLV